MHDEVPYHGVLHEVPDFDRDGYAELVFESIYRNPASAGYQTMETGLALSELSEATRGWLRLAADPRAADCGDVNGDGFADIAFVRQLEQQFVTVIHGDASGEAHIGSSLRVMEPETGARTLSVSPLLDLDGDGYADQAWFANVARASEPPDWRVYVLLGGRRGLPWQPTREVYRYEEARIETLRAARRGRLFGER